MREIEGTRKWVEKPPLVNELAARYPELPRRELEIAAGKIIEELESGMREGRQLALFKQGDDGSVELDIVYIERHLGEDDSRKRTR